jgi:hypothetical protein
MAAEGEDKIKGQILIWLTAIPHIAIHLTPSGITHPLSYHVTTNYPTQKGHAPKFFRSLKVTATLIIQLCSLISDAQKFTPQDII